MKFNLGTRTVDTDQYGHWGQFFIAVALCVAIAVVGVFGLVLVVLAEAVQLTLLVLVGIKFAVLWPFKTAKEIYRNAVEWLEQRRFNKFLTKYAPKDLVDLTDQTTEELGEDEPTKPGCCHYDS
jgi:hypothetical protein